MEGKKKFSVSVNFVFLIVLLGALLRFYKLDWGGGNFFHPDEYHIAAAVSRLNFPSQMNPELFSYGSFSVYLIYFAKTIFLLKSNPILIGRILSALASTATIYVFYLISKEIFQNRKYHLLTSFLIAITPGLIQQAHFATPESILTLWIGVFLLFILKWFDRKESRQLFYSAVSIGFAMGTKIVSAILLPILAISPFLIHKRINFQLLIKRVAFSISLLVFAFISYLLVFPYSLLDKSGFINSMNYESAVALGDMIVFYTRQFVNTKPITFQFIKILPYTLGIGILLLGVFGVILIIARLLRDLFDKKINLKLTTIVISFMLLFISNSILFAKWTRFIAPTFPFFAIFSTYAIHFLTKLSHKPFVKYISNTLSVLLIASSIVWTCMFFSIYKSEDVRISATKWVNENIPLDSIILTESGNTLEVPLHGSYNKIAFNFYELENDIVLQKELPYLLEQADYFIIQSRRIFMNHLVLSKDFPNVSRFYEKLFSGDHGFTLLAEFSSYPKINIFEFSFQVKDELAEETWSVFDHPVIRVYKKNLPFAEGDYEKVLKI